MLRSFATEAQDDKLTVTLKRSGSLDQTPSSPLLAQGGGRRGWVFYQWVSQEGKPQPVLDGLGNPT